MNLNDLRNNKKSKTALKVLRENYNVSVNLNKLNFGQTKTMLAKVRSLISETRNTSRIHSSHNNPDYLKLLMMEQALSGHLNDLRASTRIVVENEEVQKSQVILAAQDMIDTVQKMLEQISKMNVEELPAVVDGITNEIGSNEGEQFSQSVGSALNALQQALSTAKQEVSSALGTVTGQTTGAVPNDNLQSDALGDEGMGGEEIGGPSEEELGGELPELPELPEEPEEEPGNTGRERR